MNQPPHYPQQPQGIPPYPQEGDQPLPAGQPIGPQAVPPRPGATYPQPNRPGWDPRQGVPPMQQPVGAQPVGSTPAAPQPPRRSLLPWLISGLLALAAVVLALLLLVPGSPLGPKPAATSPATTPAGPGTPAPTVTAPTPGPSSSTPGRPKPSAAPSPGSSKQVGEITLPAAIGTRQRGTSQTPGGPIMQLAYYGEGRDKVSVTVQRDHRVAVDGAGLRDVVDADTYRCGRATTTAVCMSDVGGGTVEVNALDAGVTPEQLGAVMKDLLAAL